MKTKISQRILSVIICLIVFFLVISNPFEREEIAIIDLLEEEYNLKTDEVIRMQIDKMHTTSDTVSVTDTKSEDILNTLKMTKVKKSYKNKVDLLGNYLLTIYDADYIYDNGKTIMIKYHSGKTYIVLHVADDTILFEATTNSLFNEVDEAYRGL